MTEFLVLSLLLLAVLVLAARRGTRLLAAPQLAVAIGAAGAFSGWLLWSLPFTPVGETFSILSVLAGFAGLMAGRLVARGLGAWARGQERHAAEAGPPPRPPRLVHPLIATGLFLSGVFLLWSVVTTRHEALEVRGAERVPGSDVLLGAEDVRLDGDPAVGHAALLVHGFLSSPTDFADLPQRLHARGLTVRAPRLPGHGTYPSDLRGVGMKEWQDAVRAAREVLSATHARVSLVGFSLGGALAALEAEREAPHRLVLVNPYLGEVATPAWLPVPTDDLVPVFADVVERVLVPPSFVRIDRRAGLEGHRFYRTVPLASVREVQEVGREMEARDPLVRVRVPILVLLSPGDEALPPERTAALVERLRSGPAAQVRLARYDDSNHILLRDHDGEAAMEEIVRFLTREGATPEDGPR